MLLASFYISSKEVFELILTRDNTKNTKNTVIEKKIQEVHYFLLKIMTSANNSEGNEFFFSDFLKLRKILNVCDKFTVFSVLPSETKRGGEILPTLPPQEKIRAENIKVEKELMNPGMAT